MTVPSTTVPLIFYSLKLFTKYFYARHIVGTHDVQFEMELIRIATKSAMLLTVVNIML